MATVSYPPYYSQKITDNAGQPVAGGKILSYYAGSDVPLAVYTEDGTSLGAEVMINGAGEALFCLKAGLSYKLVCIDADGAVVWTRDNVKVNVAGDGMANPMESEGDMIVGAVDGQPERLAAPANASFLRSYKNSDNVPVVKWSQLKAGANVTITDAGTQVTVAADTQTGDHKVKVDALDSEAGYLVQKLYGGTMVNVSTAYDGDGYEHLQVDLATAGSVAGDVLTADGNGGATFSAPAPQPGDHKTAVDGADASPDYLANKLAAGSGISLTNTGSAVEIAADAQSGDHKLLVSATDAAAGYLGSKLTAGSNVTLTQQTDGDGVQTLEISATGGGGGGGDWTSICGLSSHYLQSSNAYVSVYFTFTPLGPSVRSILIPYAHFSYSKNVTAKIAVWKCGAFNGGVSLGTPIAEKTFTQAIKHPLTWFDFDADVDVSDKTANYIFGYSTNSPDNGNVKIICDDSSADNNFGLVSYQMKSNNSWDNTYPLWYGGKRSMAFGLSSAAQNS